MKVYLYLCCLNRLTDDQTQRRIREEAEAVERIFKRMRDGEVQWISSEALSDEINRNPHLERRLENAALMTLTSEIIEINQDIARRAGDLQVAGYGAFDALHLACAEAANVDALLTTDDGFVRKASRADGSPRVMVRNPLSWSQENFREQPRHND
jgi:predicted nucleic acid-binding protein